MTYTSTQIQILTNARTLIQTKGFNGFSYKDISGAIGIKTSSIHYHYPTKEDLGATVIDWHVDTLRDQLEEIANNARFSTNQKMHEFFNLIVSGTYDNDLKMCLGGIFAVEMLSLPKALHSKIRIFFDTLVEWIELVLVAGANQEGLSIDVPRFSKALLINIEGALLLIRLYQDESYLDAVHQFIDQFI